MHHALSFDVEEYFQVSNFARTVTPADWDRFPSRVEASTERVLHLLDEHGTRATFFVLGWIAERHPELVRRIAATGNEIASHGWDHRLVYDMTPEAFRADVARTKGLLEDLSGRAVLGYRAPSFSITPRSAWAFAVLAEVGYRYDSSVFPVRHPRYGWRSSPTDPHVREAGEGRTLHEFPPLTLRVLGARLPAAGGAYLRIFPPALVHLALRKAERRGVPGVVYAHPWELDPDQPRIPCGLGVRVRHYRNLERMESRLRALLRVFSFTTLAEVLGLEVRA